MALAKSLNTVAAELSFAVGREKVHRDDQASRASPGIGKSCSMALGDYGITPAAPARRQRSPTAARAPSPTPSSRLFNSEGELVYSRERDEPEPALSSWSSGRPKA